MTQSIEIGKTGHIIGGTDVGMYVRIEDDATSAGGFLILTSHTNDFATGFDNWVVDRAELERYVTASAWEINWF